MRPYRFLVIIIMLTFISLTIAQESTSEVTTAPTPQVTIEGERATLDVYFRFLQQGRVGLVRVTGDNIDRVTGDIFLQPLNFFMVERDNGWFALVTAEIDQAIRSYTLPVTITYADGTTETLTASFDVTSGGFIQQTVTLVEDIDDVLDDEAEQNELDRIFQLAEAETSQVLWSETGFGAPVDGELTSPFGAVRTFNGGYNSRHTGWDFQADIGEPMVASSSGRVVFAGMLPIRGNYVLIDHGRGVYSGYAHLSVVYVTQGQSIHSGQIIGQVGSTGRSSSAHAHVEFIVNQQWVDAADFIRMYVP